MTGIGARAQPRKPRSRRSAEILYRAQEGDDEALVRRAHVADRAASFAHVDWPAAALARLCDQQHDLQERHIAIRHPQAERRMIMVAGETAGRLCLDRTGTPWRLVDIVLLPEAQGRGIGTAALGALLAEAGAAGAAIELQVARDKPRAEALYRRLGFVEAIGASATHLRMIHTPRARAVST